MDADAHRALAEVLGTLGDFTRAQAEFETALRLNPGHAIILANYADWAGTFGHPKLGAEAADRAIRLNPNYGVGTAEPVPQRLLLGGAVRRRAAHGGATATGKPDEMGLGAASGELRCLGTQRGSSGGGRGSIGEAPRPLDPRIAQQSRLGEAERKQMEGLMREAGFPVCAKPEELAKFEKPLRLPECPLPEAAK